MQPLKAQLGHMVLLAFLVAITKAGGENSETGCYLLYVTVVAHEDRHIVYSHFSFMVATLHVLSDIIKETSTRNTS